MKKLFLFTLTSFLFIGIYAQTKPKKIPIATNDIEKYLDDGGITERKNMLRIKLIKIIKLEFGASYERKFGRWFGLECGAFYQPIRNPVFEFPLDAPLHSSTKITIAPKFYFSGKNLNNGFYIGLNNEIGKGKIYSGIDFDAKPNPVEIYQKINYSEHTLFLGSHTNYKKNWTVGLDFHGGIYTIRLPNAPLILNPSDKNFWDQNAPILKMEINVGYLF